MQRMQTVISWFLQYQGRRPNGPLRAHPVQVNWEARAAPGAFDVEVCIRDDRLLMDPESELVPGQREVRQAQAALAWVLRALFDHAEELGLKPPVFW